MDAVLNKVIETINSCETPEHLKASKRFMFLYLKAFKDNVTEYDNKYNELNKFFRNKRGQLTTNDKNNSR